MKSSIAALLLCASVLGSCSVLTPQIGPHIINKKLSSSYSNFDNSFEKFRTPLSFGKDRIANNCETYFELNANNKIDETINNQTVKSEYLICDSMQILAQSSGIKNINVIDLGKQLSTKLDLRTFPSSLSRLGNKNSYTLMSLFPKHTTSNTSTALYETDDWAFTIEVVAIANILTGHLKRIPSAKMFALKHLF